MLLNLTMAAFLCPWKGSVPPFFLLVVKMRTASRVGISKVVLNTTKFYNVTDTRFSKCEG